MAGEYLQNTLAASTDVFHHLHRVGIDVQTSTRRRGSEVSKPTLTWSNRHLLYLKICQLFYCLANWIMITRILLGQVDPFYLVVHANIKLYSRVFTRLNNCPYTIVTFRSILFEFTREMTDWMQHGNNLEESC